MDMFSIIGSILQAIVDFLPTIFKLFKEAKVAIGLSLGIFLLAAFMLVWLRFVVVKPLMSRLKEAAFFVRNLEPRNGFLENFGSVDSVLSGIPAVKHGWGDFKKRMIFPEAKDLGLPIRATESPGKFIHAHGAEGRALHLKLYAALPDYLVGLGLVLTFLGLVSALYFAAQGLEAGDVAETRASLTALLSAATFKFITSIAGVASSIIFSVFFNKYMGQLDRTFIELTETIELHVFYTLLGPKMAKKFDSSLRR